MEFSENSGGLGGLVVSDRRGHVRLAIPRSPQSTHWSKVNTVDAIIRRNPWLLHLILILFAATLLLLNIVWPKVPVVIMDVVPESLTAIVGKPVSMKFHFDRARNCPGVVDSGWVDINGKDLINFPSRPTTPTRFGDQWMTANIPGPASVGYQCYQSIIRYQCYDGSFTVVSPQACVTAIAGDAP